MQSVGSPRKLHQLPAGGSAIHRLIEPFVSAFQHLVRTQNDPTWMARRNLPRLRKCQRLGGLYNRQTARPAIDFQYSFIDIGAVALERHTSRACCALLVCRSRSTAPMSMKL